LTDFAITSLSDSDLLAHPWIPLKEIVMSLCVVTVQFYNLIVSLEFRLTLWSFVDMCETRWRRPTFVSLLLQLGYILAYHEIIQQELVILPHKVQWESRQCSLHNPATSTEAKGFHSWVCSSERGGWYHGSESSAQCLSLLRLDKVLVARCFYCGPRMNKIEDTWW